MRLGMYVESWRGRGRLARDLPVIGWTWTEKHAAMPAGKLSLDFPASWWPERVTDPLRPMGQTLRAELRHDDLVTLIPPCRIVEASESSGAVSVVADTIDGDIPDDPWPVPSSPATGATLLQEATRLAAPLRVRLEIPDVVLPDGLAWSGDRDKALLELVSSRAARWQLDADGVLVALPLGNVAEPDRTYGAREVVEARRQATRSRVTRATVVAPGTDDEPPVVIERRRTEPELQPDVYGVIGRVETLSAGTAVEQLEETADAMLAEGGSEREFVITPDPTLRAGMIVRCHIERRGGIETVIGRVVSHTLKSNGSHTITIREAL